MRSLYRDYSKEAEDKVAAKRELQRQKYELYHLKENPFPLGGSFPQGYMRSTWMRPDHEEKIDRFLLFTFFRQEFLGVLILGEYGAGKTHLLNYIHEKIKRDPDNLFDGLALSFMISNPTLSPEGILLRILQEIGLGTLQDLIYLPVRKQLTRRYGGDPSRFLSDFVPRLRHQFTLDFEMNPSWKQTFFTSGYREFVRRLKEQNYELDIAKMQAVTRQVLSERISSDAIVVESLVGLMFHPESADTGSWESFLLSNFAGKRGKVVGIEFYLEAVLNLLKEMGIQHVYLLVDELEDLRTSRLSEKALVGYLTALRRMIEHNYRMFSFILASARDAWEEIKTIYASIEDRFPIIIELGADPEFAKDVIAKYLSQARTESFDTELYDIWYPFSEEAISHIIELRGNVLRHILTECRNLIDIGVEKQVAAPLVPQFVDEQISAKLMY